MDVTKLQSLKPLVDAVIQQDTPAARSLLADALEQALRDLRPASPLPMQEDGQAALVVQAFQDAWNTAGEASPLLSPALQAQPGLADLLSALQATQRFALALSRGDLSQSLTLRGGMAGSLKSLQASLRHLTWQTEMIAQGDFTQKVDFMGEFSNSFNTMVSSLERARGQIEAQNQELERINADLRAEISGRLQANARTEIQHRLLEQREQERLQIARDLHDGPLQDLIALLFSLESILQASAGEDQRALVTEAIASARQLISELRAVAGELRPPSLSKFGLSQAIQSHVDGFQSKHPELRIELSLDPEDRPLPEATALALFRILQESLNNLVRHSGATQVRIRLRVAAAQVILEVADNGQGFTPPTDWLELARQGHLGLVGLRERAEAIGGHVEIESSPGHGATLHISAPV